MAVLAGEMEERRHDDEVEAGGGRCGGARALRGCVRGRYEANPWLCTAMPGAARDRSRELADRHLSDEVLLRRANDSTGEFAAYARKNPDSRVVFWEDVYTTKPGSLQRVGPPRRTAASLLAWLQGNPNLTVSRPTSGRIGAIRARVVDVGVADDAVNDDPGCPAKPCANFLGYPQWGETYGIAGKWISRFYMADVRYGGKQHLFVAVLEVAGPAQLRAFLPEARKVIASVRVPALSA